MEGREGEEGEGRFASRSKRKFNFPLVFPFVPACAHRGKLGRGILQKQIDAKQRHCLPACPSSSPSPFSAWFSIRNPRLSSEECALGGFPPPPLPPLPLLRRVALGIIVRVVRELVKTGERKRGGWRRLFLIRERGRQIYGNDIGNVKEERGLVKW